MKNNSFISLLILSIIGFAFMGCRSANIAEHQHHRRKAVHKVFAPHLDDQNQRPEFTKSLKQLEPYHEIDFPLHQKLSQVYLDQKTQNKESWSTGSRQRKKSNSIFSVQPESSQKPVKIYLKPIQE